MLNMKHGGHVQDAIEDTSLETPFAYLKPGVAADPTSQIPGDPVKVTADLKALGAAMVDDAAATATDPAVRSTRRSRRCTRTGVSSSTTT